MVRHKSMHAQAAVYLGEQEIVQEAPRNNIVASFNQVFGWYPFNRLSELLEELPFFEVKNGLSNGGRLQLCEVEM